MDLPGAGVDIKREPSVCGGTAETEGQNDTREKALHEAQHTQAGTAAASGRFYLA
jgi:hypothetical protein